MDGYISVPTRTRTLLFSYWSRRSIICWYYLALGADSVGATRAAAFRYGSIVSVVSLGKCASLQKVWLIADLHIYIIYIANVTELLLDCV